MVDYTLINDEIYIYPTDTVWGMGGSILSHKASVLISKIKGRENNKPQSILFSSPKQILDFIKLPEKMTEDWLSGLFKLEVTLGVPKSWFKSRLGSWIAPESDFIALRCLETSAIFNFINEVGAPVTTTSLNLSGGDPIVDKQKAHQFFLKEAPTAEFLCLDKHKLSGVSSTIIFYQDGFFKILRAGRRLEEVQNYVKLFTA